MRGPNPGVPSRAEGGTGAPGRVSLAPHISVQSCDLCISSCGSDRPSADSPCRLSQDVPFFSLSCRFSGAVSLSTQTGTQGSSQPNAQNTGVYDTFWDLPSIFLRRNKVKSELANVSLAFYSHDFHPHQTQRLSQYLCIFLSHCCGTATTPGK